MPYRSPVTSGIRATGFNLSRKIGVKLEGLSVTLSRRFCFLYNLHTGKKIKRANSEILSKVVVVSERAAKQFFVARNTEP